jgi:transposase
MVKHWIKRLVREGLKGVRDKRERGQPRRLSPTQDGEILRLLIDDGDCSVPELCAFVAKRFGVRYSASGMKYHVEKCLGFRWLDGRAVRRRRR